jgi:hypothetical protein
MRFANAYAYAGVCQCLIPKDDEAVFEERVTAHGVCH